MADSNSINIGGVKFNKADIKSAGTVEREGKTLNSVFLKDGTQVVFPNQSEKNESSVEQHNHVTSKPVQKYGMHMSVDGEMEMGWYMGTERTEHPDKKVTTFNRMAKAEITGTENEDRYYLEGCKDSKVDVSQEDGYNDYVNVSDNTRIKSLFSTETYESSGNEVKLNYGDEAITKNDEKGWFKPDYKKQTGPGTVKE